MEIYIFRDNQQNGPYSETELLALEDSMKLESDDKLWAEEWGTEWIAAQEGVMRIKTTAITSQSKGFLLKFQPTRIWGVAAIGFRNKTAVGFLLLFIILTPIVIISNFSLWQNSEADFLIGQKYYDGDGYEVDFQKAAKWYKKSADKGHREGQIRIATMYREGIGVEQNTEKAQYYFELANNQSDAKTTTVPKHAEERNANLSRSYPEEYAYELKRIMLSGGQCDQLRMLIDLRVASSLPDNIKMMQIEKFADMAEKSRCIRW